MNDAALAIALILQVLDVLTTRAGMRKGLGEGNPVMRAVMRGTAPVISCYNSKTSTVAVRVDAFAIGRWF